jgi:hypothetical protein
MRFWEFSLIVGISLSTCVFLSKESLTLIPDCLLIAAKLGNQNKGKIVKTENLVPTWEAVLPIYLMAYENGENKGRSAALEELQRMARLADLYLAAKKGGAL